MGRRSGSCRTRGGRTSRLIRNRQATQPPAHFHRNPPGRGQLAVFPRCSLYPYEPDMGASLVPCKTANWPAAKAMLLMGQDTRCCHPSDSCARLHSAPQRTRGGALSILIKVERLTDIILAAYVATRLREYPERALNQTKRAYIFGRLNRRS